MGAQSRMVELRTLDRKMLCRVSQDGRTLEIMQRGVRYEVDLVAVWMNASAVYFVMAEEDAAAEAREEGEETTQ